MKSKSNYRVFGILIFIVAFSLCLLWYDWRLALIIFLFSWSNNLMLTDSIINYNKVKTKTNGTDSKRNDESES